MINKNKREVKFLTPRERLFVFEYVKEKNITHAALKAGYAEKGASVSGSRMLKKPKVKDAIEKRFIEMAERAMVTEDYVISKLKEIAERCMQAMPVMGKKGDEWVQTGKWEFDAAGANRALELLGKNLGMFYDRVEHSGNVGSRLIFVHPTNTVEKIEVTPMNLLTNGTNGTNGIDHAGN